MANEQDRDLPPGNDDRVQAWLKNQERDPEAQANSKAMTVIPEGMMASLNHGPAQTTAGYHVECCLGLLDASPPHASFNAANQYYCMTADGKGAKAGAGPTAVTYKAPAYNAPDVERVMLTKQKQPLGEEPREFIRYK